MKFKIAKAPIASPVDVGQTLSLFEAAQFLEMNAALMATRSKEAAVVITDDSAYWLEILHDD